MQPWQYSQHLQQGRAYLSFCAVAPAQHLPRNDAYARRRRVAISLYTYFEVPNTFGRLAAGVFFVAERVAPQAIFFGGVFFVAIGEKHFNAVFAAGVFFFTSSFFLRFGAARRQILKTIFLFLHCCSAVLLLRGMVNCDSNHIWDRFWLSKAVEAIYYKFFPAYLNVDEICRYAFSRNTAPAA